MGIIHELGEVYAGDYTPFDNITLEEKHNKEKEAILKVLQSIDEDNDYFEIWEEFEKAENKYNCPIVISYSEVIKNNIEELKKDKVNTSGVSFICILGL